MKPLLIKSEENNLQITFSQAIETIRTPIGEAEFYCIRVEFENITNDKNEYVYIDEVTEECFIKLNYNEINKFKHLCQNTYKLAMKENIQKNNNINYHIINYNMIGLTTMEEDTNLYLQIIENEIYLKIDTFIGNILQKNVNIFAPAMIKAYKLINNYLEQNQKRVEECEKQH